jgi:soluble lytic murein transglycosylase-like protein
MTSVISEKTSLLSTLLAQEAREQSAVRPGSQPEGLFAGKLDSALATDGQQQTFSSTNAQSLAEIFNLQMLHSTLALAGGDQQADSPVPSMFDRQSATIRSLIRTYGANQPESGAQTLQPDQTGQQIPVSPEVTPIPNTTHSTAATGTQWLDPIITRASDRYGVDAGLIKAVIKAESNFNTNAVSSAGARGLMQLMPGTARSLGVSDSFDPEQNVMAGTRFLRDLLNRYKGDLDSTLAAYNWGPGNVDKRSGHLPRETRDYLSRVKQLYASYTA